MINIIEDKYYIDAKIVIINSDNIFQHCYYPSSQLMRHDNNFLYYPSHNIRTKAKPQYVYITSNEKIKEGDWYVNLFNPRHIFIEQEDENMFTEHHSGCCKIIATTDISLKLPQPPKEFIEEYIESYNNGKPINDALIEVNLLCCQTGINCGFPCNGDCTVIAVPELKVDKNNVIAIKKINDKWNDIFQEYLKENPTFDNAKVSFLSYLEDNFNPPIKK